MSCTLQALHTFTSREGMVPVAYGAVLTGEDGVTH